MTPEQAFLVAMFTAFTSFIGLITLAMITIIFGVRTNRQLINLHVDLNSRLSQLIAAERGAGKAEGLAEGKGQVNEL